MKIIDFSSFFVDYLITLYTFHLLKLLLKKKFEVKCVLSKENSIENEVKLKKFFHLINLFLFYLQNLFFQLINLNL